MKFPVWGHVLWIAAAVAVTILCTLLPFLPGPYDPLALPLSMMARVTTLGGLLLVPIGAVWIASRHSRALADRQHVFAVLALAVSALVWVLMSLAAWPMGSLSLAVMSIAGRGLQSAV